MSNSDTTLIQNFQILLPVPKSELKGDHNARLKRSQICIFFVELFYAILNMQLQQLNNCLNEKNIELLLCLTYLCPNDSFVSFDKQKLVGLDEFYSNNFSSMDLVALEIQLDVYIIDVGSNYQFSGLKKIGEMARKMVKTKKDKLYSLVYLLVTLALILPLVIDSMKNHLQSWIGDQ